MSVHTKDTLRKIRRELIRQELDFQKKFPPVELRSTTDMVRVREVSKFGYTGNLFKGGKQL